MRILSAVIAATALATAGHAQAQPQAQTPAHYDLKARLDAAAGRIAATLTVSLPVGAGDTAFVLADRFRIERVDAGPGGAATIAPVDTPIPHLNRIAFHFTDPRAPHWVSIVYDGVVNDPDDPTPALSPQRIELNIEDMWLPAREDLGLAFTADAEITGLPHDLVAISQGRFERRGDRLIIHRAEAETDLPIDGAVGLTMIHSADVDFWAAEQDDPLVAALRRDAFGAAAFYRKLYGAPAIDPVRMVIVPRGDGAGYGERSFVVMPTFRKPGAPTPKFDETSPASFVAHEFRHAWMPNLQGVPTDDTWLSESVAEYFGLRYVEVTFGVKARDVMLERKRKAATGAGPLIGLGKKPSGAALYQEGPVLLFDLEAKIGRPAVDRVLVRKDPPLTTQAFSKSLREVAGADVARDFEATLRSGVTNAP
ncbi:MAG TPA: hypothetical protein VG407_11925 [Caulobacteraceae bacterium]|jgi:hypothetical protein|nr:hypothetical protein [Caulobacteraceae bacterium]